MRPYPPPPGTLAADCASEVLAALKRLARLRPRLAFDRLRVSFRACLATYEYLRRRRLVPNRN